MDFSKFKSRKLWVTVLLSALTTLAHGIGVSPDIIAVVIGLLGGTYNIGQGLADKGKEASEVQSLLLKRDLAELKQLTLGD